MSWCTAREVADLIYTSRFRSDIEEAERKAADLRLIGLQSSSVNIGDVLTELAVASSNVTGSVRHAAALALESLMTKLAWCEGRSFSDKSHVLSALLVFLRGDAAVASTVEGHVRESLCSCLCRVICLEYPAAHWDAFIDEHVAAIVSCSGHVQLEGDARVSVVFHRALILRLSERCASNGALWWCMASVVARRLLESLSAPDGERRRAFCFRVILHLMRRQPRPSEVAAGEQTSSSFIFSNTFREFVASSLREDPLLVAGTHDTIAPLEAVCFEDCRLLLDMAQHLVRNMEFAALVFGYSTHFLSRFQDAYANDSTHIAPVIACIDSALECVFSVLQTFPAIALQCEGKEILSALFCYMTRAATVECGDEAALLESLQDEYVVLLGCAGGSDTAGNAGGALELLMEANPKQLGVVVEQLCICIDGLQHGAGSPHWRAWAAVLRCCCRVCDEKELSFTDSMPDVTGRLLTPLAQLLLQQQASDPWAAAELISLLSLCLSRATQESVCRAFFSILDFTFKGNGNSDDAAGTRGAGGGNTSDRLPLLAVVVYALQRLLSTCALSITSVVAMCDVGLWMERALVVMSHGGSLAVYCGARTVQTLLRLLPGCTAPPPLLLAAVENACRQCIFPDAASLLAGLFSSLCVHAPGDCRLATELLHLLSLHCRPDSRPHRSELLRSLVCYALGLPRAIMGGGCVCVHCVDTQVLHHCLPGILQFAKDDGPHDEATTRLVSNSLAAVVVVVAVVSSGPATGAIHGHVGGALAKLLRAAVDARHSCTTLSTITAAMSAVALSSPTILDGDMTETVSLVFGSTGLETRKGVDYVGCCLLPVLSLIRHPQLLDTVASGLTTTQLCADVAWATMFGLWSSVAAFADHFATMYFLAAWCRLLRYAITASEEGRNALKVDVPCCKVYSLSNLHAASFPTGCMAGCSIAQCIALGLALVVRRKRGAPRRKLLDAEVLRPLCITRRFEALARCSVHNAGVGELLSMGPVEGAEWLLQLMAGSGYGRQVDIAMRFAVKSPCAPFMDASMTSA